MSSNPFKGIGSPQISLLICMALAAGLWLTQQFSKEYQRWLNIQVQISMPSDAQDEFSFKGATLRLRLKQAGWYWAFESRDENNLLHLDWAELQKNQWDRSGIYELIAAKLPFDPESVIEMDGLDQITGLRERMVKKIPVRILPGKASIPTGYILSDHQLLLPDSIFLVGTEEALMSYHSWTIDLPENMQIKSGNEVKLELEQPNYPNLILSPQTIKWIPHLDQITEKKWEIPVILPDSIQGSYITIPRSVQLTVQLPASKFDNDSLKYISAILSQRGRITTEDLQVLDINVKPSFIKKYRLSPPFVSLFRIEE